MTNYIDQLSAEEEKALLASLHYNPRSNGFRTGHQTYYQNGYKVYHTWDHDYSSSKDYDDEFIFVSDFDVRSDLGRNAKYVSILFSFMYNKFHSQWAEDAIKYYKNRAKENNISYSQTIKYIQNLDQQTNQTTQDEVSCN